MNPDLDRLLPYPFERLAALFSGVEPASGSERITLSIGEPRHPPPAWLPEILSARLSSLSVYPSTRGLSELRIAIAGWLMRRFGLADAGIDPDNQVLPVNGTREALFSFAQAVVNPGPDALVLLPNPGYQIYEGATLLAGAEPHYLPCIEANGFLPDFESVAPDTWRRCQLLYLCSPANPTGAVIPQATLQRLIALAEEHDFIIAADECYSELYFDEAVPPVGLLQAAAAMGYGDYRRCVVFHSLSKRSNVPGLRSGFVAGDARIIARYFRYRTYHGCAMPLHHQYAGIAAWGDEDHVVANRRQYREKFTMVLSLLDGLLPVSRPDGGFYLWPSTPIEDTDFARGLFAAENLVLLPGRYLSHAVDGIDPGARRLRIALVPPLDTCLEAVRRLRRYIESL